MKIPKSFLKIRELLDRPSHAYKPTTETFPELDADRVAADLRLRERGKERGTANQPQTDDQVFDSVETEVVELISAAQKRSHDQLENDLTGFRQRLIDLDFEARFSAIKSASQSGLSEIFAEQQIGLDDLHDLRQDVRRGEEWYSDFRDRNRLRRPAKKTTTSGTWLKWILIGLLVIIELFINGELLRKGNELGLIGGIVEATLFAFLNIGVALLFAFYLLPQLNHRNFLRKLLGLISLVVYVGLAIGINLALAHYREVAGSLVSGADQIILQRLQTDALGLTEFRSWVLFGVGLLFSVIACIDGLSMHDAYPGFAGVDKRLEESQARYRNERQRLIRELSEVREDIDENLADLRADLSRQRTEHDSIVSHRSRKLTLFEVHQEHLEKVANLLLRIYRDANVKARSTPAPAHFGSGFALKRIQVQLSREGEWNSDDLQRSIRDAQSELDVMHAELSKRFEAAIQKYRELDIINPDR